MTGEPATVNEYILSYPEPIQAILADVRAAIHRGVPDAGEKISYKMPTITLDGVPLLHFAAWKHHIALYPVPVGMGDAEPDVAPYRSTKDTVQFRYAKPIPYDLIERIATLHVARRRGNSC